MVSDEHFKKGIETTLQGLELIDETLINVTNSLDSLREKLGDIHDTLEELKEKK